MVRSMVERVGVRELVYCETGVHGTNPSNRSLTSLIDSPHKLCPKIKPKEHAIIFI